MSFLKTVAAVVVLVPGALAAHASTLPFATFSDGLVEFDGSSFWKDFPEIPVPSVVLISELLVTASGGTSSGPSGEDPFISGTTVITGTVGFGQGFTNIVMTGHGEAQQVAGAGAGSFPGGLNFRAFAGDNGFGGDNNLTPLVLQVSEKVGYELTFSASGDFANTSFSQITLVDQFDQVISGRGTLQPGQYRILFDFGLDLGSGERSDIADFTWTLSLVPAPSALVVIAMGAVPLGRRRR
jgi:hypothetical protein